LGNYRSQQLRKIGLSAERAMELASSVTLASFRDGQTVWAKGSEIASWSFIVNGLVAASVPTPNSSSTPISIYGAGAWFGEQPIINRKPSYAEYVCLAATELLSMPATQVVRLLETEPGFSLYMTKLMAWRVQKTSEMLMLMKLGNPCLRVVMGIAQFAEALSYNASRPPTIGFGEGIEIPIKQQVLASLCGVSRTLFSEFVQQLATNGWLRTSYGKLEILSVGVWHRFAQGQRERNMNNLTPAIEELLQELKRCDPFCTPMR